MNIFVSQHKSDSWADFLTEENLQRLHALGNVTFHEGDKPLTEDELCEAVRDQDILITCWGVPKISERVLKHANRLKLIGHLAGSVAYLVNDAVYDKGIRVVCGNEAFAESVAEGTLAYILAAQRRITKFDREVHEDGWSDWPFVNYSLLRRKVGIVGFGAVAKHLVRMLKPFMVEILVYSSHMTEQEAAALGVRKASLEEIFSGCSVITLHTAQHPKTNGMITKELLAMMPDDALLVNTSRPAVLDEDALCEECRTGRIRAALDVYKNEGTVPLECGLREFREVLMMPHHAGPTIDYRRYAARYVLEDLERFVQGQPLEHEISQKRMNTMTR